jgi:hypothetical protein
VRYDHQRTYKTGAGYAIRLMRPSALSHSAHAEIEMKILGPFLSVEDPDTFSLCAAFRTCFARPMKAKFYEGSFGSELKNLLTLMLVR